MCLAWLERNLFQQHGPRSDSSDMHGTTVIEHPSAGMPEQTCIVGRSCRAPPWYIQSTAVRDWASRLQQGRLHNGVFELEVSDVKMICVRSFSFHKVVVPRHCCQADTPQKRSSAVIYILLFIAICHASPTGISCLQGRGLLGNSFLLPMLYPQPLPVPATGPQPTPDASGGSASIATSNSTGDSN